jgi:glycosyltransferase involved in cell wall biosynthesis
MTYLKDEGQPGNREGRELKPNQSGGQIHPNLSVIVANYNNELYIRECLDSILNQTFKNLEIIVSDDASTDNSPSTIKEYEGKYPGVLKGIFCPVNRGVAQNRHEAILQAKSVYITTLDSDDYYYDAQKLEKEMALISHYKKEKGKDIIAFSNILLVKGDKTLIKAWGNPGNIKEGIVFYEIITRACMIPRDFIMKKAAYFEVGGYDFQFTIYEDWDLKIRLAKKYEFYYTGINGIGYRRHGTGLSAVPISQNIKWLKKVFKKNKGLIDKTQKKEAVKAIDDFTRTMKARHRKCKPDPLREKN